MKKVNQELWNNVVDRMTKEETEELLNRFSNVATLNFGLGWGFATIGTFLCAIGAAQIPRFRRWLNKKLAEKDNKTEGS